MTEAGFCVVMVMKVGRRVGRWQDGLEVMFRVTCPGNIVWSAMLLKQ